MKIRIILGLHSGMSSQTMKMMAPSFLAIEIAYLELASLSSSVSPAVTRSQLTTRGSMDAQRWIKNLPSASALSLKEVI